ncbi:AI-2E family transporter [Pelomonas sp. KK5]|uniref:AI-2E family transporter n=1 Tax=Pelomonas sp. KK5 TaxID=1855730 RepID=UPI001E2ABF35|nr:AI-2E family transporter [Pelomonas sp. KK5]
MDTLTESAVQSAHVAAGHTDSASEAGRAEAQRVLLHMPVDIRSASLGVLTFLATLLAMQWAREVLIPILLGVLLSYALTPAVTRISGWGVPRGLAAGLLLTAISVGMAWGAWSLTDEVNALVETLPRVTQKVRELAQGKRGTVSTIDKVQKAAAELEAATVAPAASDSASAPASKARKDARSAGPDLQVAVPTSQAHPSRIDVRAYLLTGTMGAVALLGQLSVVLLIALFLLASGNSFRRKMVKLAGPKFSQKKVTIETLDEISEQIQRYLLVQVAVSVLVGVVTGITFLALGVEQPAVWGVVAGLTNFIPYLGALIVGAGSAVTALVQFGTLEMALAVGGSTIAIHMVIGNLLTPWLMGKTSRMSPVAVFVVVLVFGWLWGIWGLFLGVPILLVVKSVCDRVDELSAVGELLGA